MVCRWSVPRHLSAGGHASIPRHADGRQDRCANPSGIVSATTEPLERRSPVAVSQTAYHISDLLFPWRNPIVWDAQAVSHACFDNLPDAINEVMRLSFSAIAKLTADTPEDDKDGNA